MKYKNLILVAADELRADFVGCYGNKVAKTPNIDKMAQEGAVFSHHFANHGKCVPSRSCIYSGRYAKLGGHRTLSVTLQPDEVNIASVLKDRGYHNVMFGNNHTIDDSWVNDIFDERIGSEIRHFIRNPKVTLEENKAMYWGSIDEDDYKSNTEVWTTSLIEWMEKYVSSSKDKPFFLNINWTNPHPPYNASAKLLEHFKLEDMTLLPTADLEKMPLFMKAINEIYGIKGNNADTLKRKILQAYYAQILDVDIQVGRILDAIERLSLDEDTIIVFMSDHGDYTGQYNMVEKWDTGFHDCLIHVPFIMKVPGYQNIQVKKMTEAVDIFPTLCDMFEIETPYGVNGKSMTHLLDDPNGEHKDYVYCEGGHEKELLDISIPVPEEDPPSDLPGIYTGKFIVRNKYPNSLRKAKMIRTTEFKYIYRVVENDELYDLRHDPNETRNLIDDSKYNQVVLEMREMLLEHLVETEENRPFDPNPVP